MRRREPNGVQARSTYQYENPPSLSWILAHAISCKCYSRSYSTPPPPIEVQGQQEYEVEEILNSKIVRNKLRYLVSWIGYAPNDRTWEPAEHLENSPEIVARYHARYPQRPSPADIPRPVARRVHFARFDTIHFI